MKTLKTVIHHFYFDISKADQAQAWEKFREERKASGVKCMECLGDSGPTARNYQAMIKKISGQEITLELAYLFDNQWNTSPVPGVSDNGLRVYDYELLIWPNRDIKSGQWLEQTEEMAQVRRDTLNCGYCGHMENISEGHTFCSNCLGHDHLKPEDLSLLRLMPIVSGKRQELTEGERAELMPLYLAAQLKGNGERSTAYQIKKRADLKLERDAALIKANMKYDGFIILLDMGLPISNVIYYDHKTIFSWGWQTPLAPEVAAEVAAKLVEFPFNWEIKTQGDIMIKKPVVE